MFFSLKEMSRLKKNFYQCGGAVCSTTFIASRVCTLSTNFVEICIQIYNLFLIVLKHLSWSGGGITELYSNQDPTKLSG